MTHVQPVRIMAWLAVAHFGLAACASARAASAAPPRGASAPTSRSQQADEEELDEFIGPTLAETMVVTTSRREVSLLEAPVSITVIGSEVLESTPATNMADLLRGVPGLNVTQVSARDINIQSRGATSTLETGQLALIDGRSLYQDFFGFVMWDVLPVNFDEIAQIEVLRGPGSAVWGANALNGVVNVRTKSPRELLGGRVEVSGGSQDSFSGSLRYAEAFERFSYKVSTSYLTQDAWPRSPRLPNGDPLPETAAFKNRGTSQPKVDFRLDYDSPEGHDWQFKLGAAGTSGIMHSGIGPFQIESGSTLSYAEVSHQRGAFDFKLYTNIMDGEAPSLLSPLNFRFDTELFVGEASFKKALGDRHFVVVGAAGRRNLFDLSIAPGDDDRTEFGVYAEDQFTVGKRFTFTLGGRLDHVDTPIGWTASPRLAVLFAPTPRQAIRLAYNRAFRMPSLVNNYLGTAIFNTIQIPSGLVDPPFVDFVLESFAEGNPDLVEEEISAYEIGYTLDKPRYVFTAAIYENTTHDLIDFYPAKYYSRNDPPPNWPFNNLLVLPGRYPKTFTYRNIGEVRDRGIELSLDLALREGLSASFTYSFQDDPRVKDDSGGDELVLNEPPTQLASASLRWARNAWSLSASLSYTDSALWTDVLNDPYWGSTDDYLLIDAGYKIDFGAKDDKTLSLKGTNLLDDPIQQHVFGDIIGRRLSASLQWRW